MEPPRDLDPIERFRSYLTLLARAHMHPVLRGKLEVSDVVQQTMLEAHRDRDRYRGESDAQRAAWLRQVLAHNLANAVRDARRAKRDVGREQSLDADADALLSKLTVGNPSPASFLVHKEQILEVAASIERLSEEQREAIVLRYWQGRSLAEIATAMDRSHAAVAGLLHRGLRRLRDVLRREA